MQCTYIIIMDSLTYAKIYERLRAVFQRRGVSVTYPTSGVIRCQYLKKRVELYPRHKKYFSIDYGIKAQIRGRYDDDEAFIKKELGLNEYHELYDTRGVTPAEVVQQLAQHNIAPRVMLVQSIIHHNGGGYVDGKVIKKAINLLNL